MRLRCENSLEEIVSGIVNFIGSLSLADLIWEKLTKLRDYFLDVKQSFGFDLRIGLVSEVT